ncbi:hypothetical protein AYK24_04565 [Thermoplasmatales archaeon SG8-52-4]|nr:MAG: hypothetical protein AYK24_04565 [Thermoplasmatales archaeon SG8-52-4]
MQNKILREGLVVGIICLLLFSTTPIMIGQNIKEVNQTSTTQNIINPEYPQPDLKIVDFYYKQNLWPDSYIVIKNIGDKTIPSGTYLKSHMVMKTKSFHQECSYTDSSTLLYPINPGKGITFLGGWFCVDKLCYFNGYVILEVDPDNKVIESNENNNVVWAYLKVVVTTYSNNYIRAKITIGELNDGYPKNIDIFNYILDKFTFNTNKWSL